MNIFYCLFGILFSILIMVFYFLDSGLPNQYIQFVISNSLMFGGLIIQRFVKLVLNGIRNPHNKKHTEDDYDYHKPIDVRA